MTAPDPPVVLHVLEAVGHGTARHLIDLVEHADAVDHVVIVPRRPTLRGQSARDDQLASVLLARGVRVHTIPLPRVPDPWRLWRSVRSTVRMIAAERATLLHGHATAGGLVARFAAHQAGLPCVYTPHGIRTTWPLARLERALARWTDAIVAVSVSEAHVLLRLGITPRGQVVIVPNGIDLSLSGPAERDIRTALGVHESPLVGWVGRFATQKAPEVLVQALDHLPDVHAVLVGGGPRTRHLVEQIRRARLTSRVHLLGHVADAARMLPQFDVLASSSRWEGAPYVPLEAFRARVPVVATDVVGTRDVVVDGETGWLVAPDDPAALAAAIRDALDRPDEARRRASLAHDRLVAHHDVRAMASATVRVYRQVTSARRGRR